jgi:hypothetical protein
MAQPPWYALKNDVRKILNEHDGIKNPRATEVAVKSIMAILEEVYSMGIGTEKHRLQRLLGLEV